VPGATGGEAKVVKPAIRGRVLLLIFMLDEGRKICDISSANVEI